MLSIIIPIGFLLILVDGMSVIPVFMIQDDGPDLVYNKFGQWWADIGDLDGDFTNAVGAPYSDGIINIFNRNGCPGPDKIIKDWVMFMNSGWWAENNIPDSDFINDGPILRNDIGWSEVKVSTPEFGRNC